MFDQGLGGGFMTIEREEATMATALDLCAVRAAAALLVMRAGRIVAMLAQPACAAGGIQHYRARMLIRQAQGRSRAPGGN
jgi:hypothetical protein